MKRLAIFLCLLALAGCAVDPPKSPMERYARLAAAAEVAIQHCGGYVGGYSSAQDLRNDAMMNLAKARQLGATDADLAQARTDALNVYSTSAALVSPQVACNKFISQIAWNSN